MIEFVNAKINIGLQIVRKRADGYHDLQTIFYPIGLHAGKPENPQSFCDMLELTDRIPDDKPGNERIEESITSRMPELEFTGRKVDCPREKNLVYKAAQLFAEAIGIDLSGVKLRLDKNLPDGAGMGGGSADATFTLMLLGKHFGIDKTDLYPLASRLGADCAFFLENRPVYAEGIGDRMTPVDLDLKDKWLCVVKPRIYISTAEAFAGVRPHEPEFDLREIVNLPISQWKNKIINDFETTLIPRFPLIGEIKERLYSHGADYASMTGSGSAIYGIFDNPETGAEACNQFKGDPTIESTYLLKM